MNTDKKISIGVDMDGVLADYVKGITKFAGMVPTSVSTTYNMVEPGLFDSREDFLAHHEQFVKNGELRKLGVLDKTASSALKEMQELGCDIHIITARHGFDEYTDEMVRQDCIAWLDDNDIPFDDITLTQDKSNIDVDYLIDDSPFNILGVLKSGSHTKPYAYRHLYNTFGCGDFDEYQESINYVDDMEDFSHAIKRDLGMNVPVSKPANIVSIESDSVIISNGEDNSQGAILSTGFSDCESESSIWDEHDEEWNHKDKLEEHEDNNSTDNE